MLVLSRHIDESIIILVPDWPPIRVMLVDLRNDKARIGVDADIRITVDRIEVWQRKQAEEQEKRERESADSHSPRRERGTTPTTGESR